MPSARVKMRIESHAIKSLVEKLAGLDRKVARKALKAGINDGTKAVLWDAKARTPRRTGLLRKSLGRKVKSYRGGAVIVGVIGPRRGFRMVIDGKPVNPVKYAHLVEYGRREVVPKKKKVLADKVGKVIYGRKVRAVAPRPFMRPAWESNKGRVVEFVVERLRAAIKEFFRTARAARAA